MNQYDLNFKFCKDGLFIWNELFFFYQIIYLFKDSCGGLLYCMKGFKGCKFCF